MKIFNGDRSSAPFNQASSADGELVLSNEEQASSQQGNDVAILRIQSPDRTPIFLSRDSVEEIVRNQSDITIILKSGKSLSISASGSRGIQIFEACKTELFPGPVLDRVCSLQRLTGRFLSLDGIAYIDLRDRTIFICLKSGRFISLPDRSTDNFREIVSVLYGAAVAKTVILTTPANATTGVVSGLSQKLNSIVRPPRHPKTFDELNAPMFGDRLGRSITEVSGYLQWSERTNAEQRDARRADEKAILLNIAALQACESRFMLDIDVADARRQVKSHAVELVRIVSPLPQGLFFKTKEALDILKELASITVTANVGSESVA